MSVTIEEAREAEQLFKWCSDLEKSEAFREVVLREVREMEAEADRCGTDVTRPAAERAEHHRALHLARHILGHGDRPGIVERKKAEAMATLQAWKESQGGKFVPLPDHQNV